MLDSKLLINEKIDYTPLVLCNTLFNIVQHETDIQGYWQDNGKLFIDNIETKKYFAIDTLYFNIEIKRLLKTEICVFYKNVYNEGIIQYKDKIVTLKNRKEILYNYNPSETEIKKLLKKYSGLTVYKIDNGNYLIEIYS